MRISIDHLKLNLLINRLWREGTIKSHIYATILTKVFK